MAPKIEGTGLGLGIVQSLVRLMGAEISIVDKEVGEKVKCFRIDVVFKVCVSDLSEDDKIVKSTPPKQGYSSSIIVIFINSDKRRKTAQQLITTKGIKVLAVENICQLSGSLDDKKRNKTDHHLI
ncbi:unnamed protein product [Lactuca saligna]|nr:unnamed protein product [Lactuca saligna]